MSRTPRHLIIDDWRENGLINSDEDFDTIVYPGPWRDRLRRGEAVASVVADYVTTADFLEAFRLSMEQYGEDAGPLDMGDVTAALQAYTDGLTTRVAQHLKRHRDDD